MENGLVAGALARKRNFVAENFAVTSKVDLEPYYSDLLAREITSLESLKKWLRHWSELLAVFNEYSRWVYIKTTIDTTDENAKADLATIYGEIFPYVSVCENQLKKKFLASPFTAQLEHKYFFPLLRAIKQEIEIFREANVPLQSQMQLKQSLFDEISGAQSVVYGNKELALSQANTYLKSTDRQQREEVFALISGRRQQDAERLDGLLSELVQLRHKIAVNAGYKNYIAFRFAELGRFDYTPDDCLQFHASVEKVLKPLHARLLEQRRKKLNLEVLKPWDLDVDSSGKPPLKPVNSPGELIDKTIACFEKLDPYFAGCLRAMDGLKLLDLGSRLNKGMGGYNISMPETGVPFIFMNSTNSEEDVITMVHESGHAFHSFLAHSLELSFFKETPSEISEVASMSMEMLTMDNWDVFYPQSEDLHRAKANYLHHTLGILPRVCIGDSFQLWMYANPAHTIEQRRRKWVELNARFMPGVIDWSGLEAVQETGYHRILHFYVVPLYYIEYGLAQLGAMSLWKNFKHSPQKAVEDYKRALSLGYTITIPEFYAAAGAKFDFSEAYMAELIDFTSGQLDRV